MHLWGGCLEEVAGSEMEAGCRGVCAVGAPCCSTYRAHPRGACWLLGPGLLGPGCTAPCVCRVQPSREGRALPGLEPTTEASLGSPRAVF